MVQIGQNYSQTSAKITESSSTSKKKKSHVQVVQLSRTKLVSSVFQISQLVFCVSNLIRINSLLKKNETQNEII
jgi:hypothetical protein